MNIVKSFANYLESADVATFGQDLFISRAASSNSFDAVGDEIPQNIWWLVAAGGFRDGVMDVYTIDIHYRDTDAEAVYDKLQSLRDLISTACCIDLEGYDVVGVEVTGFFTDQDIDDEERTVGLLQVNITSYERGHHGAIS